MSKVKRVKVRPGLYKLDGVTHTAPHYRGGPVCGGQVFAEFFEGEWDGDEKLADSWECFCEGCGDCDFNGWPTLADCVRESPEFWCARVKGNP